MLAVERVLPLKAKAITADLEGLRSSGFSAAQIALLLDTLIADRVARPSVDDNIELVTSGPEAAGITNRDTRAVVCDLFAEAKNSVFVAGFAVYQGQQIFRALADRMHDRPNLDVRLFLDVQRNPGDTSRPEEIVRRFADRFVRTQWPSGRRLPQLYYYPRSLDLEARGRASLHAKCIVVDACLIFVSSANFTEAAQERNIEVGLLLRSQDMAARLLNHFSRLVAEVVLVPLSFGAP
jgi:phosphatidylserine/phosphatidylglycerophosphate/cardiolipin synthase-like enzyme